MGFRFNRRIRVLPGVRLNLSKSGVSTSFGGRGAWVTLGICVMSAAAADDLSSLKNLRLAMTLPELRAAVGAIRGTAFSCNRSKFFAVCTATNQSVAEVRADIVVEFVPMPPVYVPRRIDVPPEYVYTPDDYHATEGDYRKLVALKHEREAPRREALRLRAAEESRVDAAYKAARIRAEFAQEAFGQVRAASAAKWGPATTKRTDTYHNAMNATFSGDTLTWMGTASELTLQERCANIARACLELNDLQLRSALEAAFAAAAKARAKDL